VELVGAGEFGWHQIVDVLAAGDQRRQDRLAESAAAVVRRHLLLDRHRLS
jgi:hypothetical protein